MPQNIHLAIDNPCHEHWDQMTPNEQGRFCASCQKTVTDFTLMTDQEVLNWLDRHKEPICGRFQPDQLQRPLLATSARKPGPGRYWQYLIALLLSSSEVAAQTPPAKPATYQQLPFGGEGQFLVGDTIMAPAPKPPSGPVRGRLMDKGGNPVPFATVLYKEKKGVSADANGYFSIPVADLAGVQTLKVSAVGYESAQIDLNKIQREGSVLLFPILQLEPSVLGGAVTVVRYKKRRPIADTLSAIKDTLITYLSPAKKDLTVYPNPVSRGNAVTIAAKLTAPGTYNVQLFNISGGLMESLTADREQLSGNLSMNIAATLPPGTYIVRLSHPELKRPYTQRIVVF